MFKKIQNSLLINHPLLWNTKLVPLTCILIVFQIIFFLVGYSFGALDFNETERNYNFDSDGIVIFFSVLISIIILILWFVFYFKNNAFKSYYPKTKFSLFKEWIIIVFVSFLLSSFIIIYLYGKDVRVRSYFSEKEATNRCEILNEASLFIGDNYELPIYVDKMVNDSLKRVPLDYVLYNEKQYSLTSLLNKKVEGYQFFSREQDSLTEIKIKNWLVDNKKDRVHSLLKNYLKIAYEHHLKANIDAGKWLSIVYNYPGFEQTKIIAKIEKDFYGNNQYAEDEHYTTAVPIGPNGEAYDTINQYIKTIGKEKYVFNKMYVPDDALNYNYRKIAEAYTDPTVKSDQILITLYFAIGLSLLLFSFKTTSGRNWLIAIISLGILNIIIGIFSIVFQSEYTFLIALILVTIVLFAYFIMVLIRNKSKGISGITLNGLLWLLPSFAPLVYFFILMIAKLTSGYDLYQYNYKNIDKMFPKIHYMESNVSTMFYLNIVFIILMMLFFSIKIKKWKGIAES